MVHTIGGPGDIPNAAPHEPTGIFRRLLVPVDFSSASRRAFALAVRIAERFSSEVIAYHAPSADGNDEFLGYTGVPWGARDVLDQARDHLRGFAEAVHPGSSTKIVVDASCDPDPVRAVTLACERHDPSLIVMGTHGLDRRRWRRSRAERIARSMTRPVLLVPGEPEPYVDADS